MGANLQITLVSRSQTDFLLLYLDGKKESGERPIQIFVLKIPTFWGFYERLLIGVKG